MEVKNLKGRKIDDVPYSGLIESLTAIRIMCEVAGQSKEHLTADDLLSIINQISEKATEGSAFACATFEELRTVREYLMSGMRVERERPH